MASSVRYAHAGSRTRVTSIGGLYDAATLHAPLTARVGLATTPEKEALGVGGGGRAAEAMAGEGGTLATHACELQKAGGQTMGDCGVGDGPSQMFAGVAHAHSLQPKRGARPRPRAQYLEWHKERSGGAEPGRTGKQKRLARAAKSMSSKTRRHDSVTEWLR